jgi:hypothetical protein
VGKAVFADAGNELVALGVTLTGQAWPAITVTSPCGWLGATSSVPALSDRPSRLARAVTAAMKSLRAWGA